MEAMTAEKLNKSYTRLSLRSDVLGLSIGTQLLVGDVASFTGEDKDGNPLSCFRTIKGFCKRLGLSRATVCRAKKTAKDKKLIAGNKKQGFASTFKIDDGEFLRLPNWVCKDEFTVREGKKRKLKKSEQLGYAYIYTKTTNKRNGKHACESSIAEIAAILNLSERTVQRAIWTLIRAGLIFLAKEDKGVNAYKKSRYVLNYRLVLAKEKTENEMRKEAERELRRADSEPFPEFTSPDEIGKEELILHNKPKKGKQAKGTQEKYSIPEMEEYKARDSFGYDFSNASTETLKSLHRFYNAVYSKLSNAARTFLLYIDCEIEERGSPPGGQA